MPVQQKVTVRVAPETVWAFLADGNNWSRWEPDIIEVLALNEGVQLGGSIRVRLKPGRMKATIRFTEVDAPRRLACKTTVANGMMTAHAVFDLTPIDGGTATEVAYTLGMGGPVGVTLQAFNPSKTAKEAGVSLENLARLLRAPVPNDPPST